MPSGCLSFSAVLALVVLGFPAYSGASVGDVACSIDRVLLEVAGATTREAESGAAHPTHPETGRSESQRAEDLLARIVGDPTLLGARPSAIPLSAPDSRYQRFERIFDRVVRASHAAGDPSVEAVLLEDPTWDALDLGGGKAVFFTGMTESLSDDELAAVIGHIIAHGLASHDTDRVASRFPTGPGAGNPERAGRREVHESEDEREADERGILYAALAGFDPYGAARFWARTSEDGTPYIRTHSSVPERLQRAREIGFRVRSYYQAGQRNPDSEELIVCNTLFCRREVLPLRVCEGGGLVALLDGASEAGLRQQRTTREIQRQEAEIALQTARERLELLDTVSDVRVPPGWSAYRGIATNTGGGPFDRHGIVTALRAQTGVVIGRGPEQRFFYNLKFRDRNQEGFCVVKYTEFS